VAKELIEAYREENGEDYNLWDYIAENVLEVEYTASGRKEYKSVKLWVTLGGPNVWVDTADSLVHLAWGSDRCEYPIPADVCDALDDIYSEFWDE
jgi:hypothetical protein